MQRKLPPILSGLVAILTFSLLATPVQADFTASYCSSQNTGNTDVFVWDWQSNGKCTDHCKEDGTWAFAVIQYKNCWCTNYIPRQQTSVGRCQSKGCPGFPSENCGSEDDNLYVYIKLSGKPSGTIGGSSPTPAPSARPSSTLQTSQTPSQAQTSIQIVTESGAIVTRIIIQTPTPNSTSSTAPVRTGSGDNGPNIGAIAGGVVGGVIGLVALVGGLVFFLWRRRKQQREAHEANPAGIGGSSTGITRNTSTMSKAGLLGGAPEIEHQYPPRIATNFSTQNSRYGTDQESISPISNRRNSQPLMIDSRLNPNAVMTFHGANLSRDSVASLDDSRDYGRQLNVRNPDP